MAMPDTGVLLAFKVLRKRLTAKEVGDDVPEILALAPSMLIEISSGIG